MHREAYENKLARAAVEYCGYGWQVVRLHSCRGSVCSCHEGSKCATPGKHPNLGNEWQLKATSNDETVDAWWQAEPAGNVGVMLGQRSNIVDVECDSPEQEAALADLFGGEFPETPTFSSGRGKHRLFQWRGDLPRGDQNGVIYVRKIGFRTGSAKAAQSVFPPSVHHSGAEYRWLQGLEPATVSVATIPDRVMAIIWAETAEGGAASGTRPPEYWQQILNGVGEGERNQSAAELIGRLLVDCRDPFDDAAIKRLWELVLAWNHANNRPPMEEKELRATFLSIVKRHRQSRNQAEFSAAMERYSGLDGPKPVEATAPPEEWRLVRVEAQPIVWHLFGQPWKELAPKGYVTLTSEQLLNARAIAVAALEQAGVPLNPDFKLFWHGTKDEEGAMSRLVRTCEKQAPDVDQRRDAYVADLILGVLSRAAVCDEPQSHGQPVKLPSGEYVFKVSTLLSKVQNHDRDVKRSEIIAVTMEAGATPKAYRIGASVVRFKSLDAKGIEALNAIARIAPEQ